MIVYNVFEEVRIIVYLLSYGVFIPSSYDLLKIIEIKNKVITTIFKLVYVSCTIILSSYFLFKLKEGYVPQYGVLIVLLGMSCYFLLIRNKYINKILKIKQILSKILQSILIIFRPFKIFKTTFLLVKQKSKKLYIKILYKRKKM